MYFSKKKKKVEVRISKKNGGECNTGQHPTKSLIMWAKKSDKHIIWALPPWPH